MRTRLGVLTAALAAVLTVSLAPTSGAGSGAESGVGSRWRVEVVDPDQSFRGLDAVGRRTAWVAGGSLTEGGDAKVYRTTDGGRSWQDVSPPGTAGLSLRDVEARTSSVATVLAIGEGRASRIYRTTDGGATWTKTFQNTDKAAFYNCLDYGDGQRGLAVSDPVDGKFRIIRTDDGGRSWEVLPDRGMPDSTGEFNFSASGDCLVIKGRHAWFGTGGARSRVFHSRDGGLTWAATDSAIPAGDAAGVFGLTFRTERHGLAVGGDFEAPEDGVDATAFAHQRGPWTSGGDLTHLGEDAIWVRRRLLLVVGESGDVAGSSFSRDGGRSWERFSDLGFHTLDCSMGRCWAAGGDGRVGKIRLR